MLVALVTVPSKVVCSVKMPAPVKNATMTSTLTPALTIAKPAPTLPTVSSVVPVLTVYNVQLDSTLITLTPVNLVLKTVWPANQKPTVLLVE